MCAKLAFKFVLKCVFHTAHYLITVMVIKINCKLSKIS